MTTMDDKFTFSLQTVKPIDDRTLVSIVGAFSSKFELPKVKYVPSANQTIRIPDLIAQSSQVSEEIEPTIEEVGEDNEEQAWETFLDLEEQYSQTNRWLAE
jgi:hypothetical protein